MEGRLSIDQPGTLAGTMKNPMDGKSATVSASV